MKTAMSFSERRLRRIWRLMLKRCNCPGARTYERYGCRGIRVCEEWAADFRKFEAWAIASGYSDLLEIDRRDSDGNYEPTNCRWATRAQNIQNIKKQHGYTSQYKGVHKAKYGKPWCAMIKVNGVKINLGSFGSEVDAAKAYDLTARVAFREFAVLNFPEHAPIAARQYQ